MSNRWFSSWRLPPDGIPLRVALIVPFFLLVLGTASLIPFIDSFYHLRAVRIKSKLVREAI
jgi:hypothetical protein